MIMPLFGQQSLHFTASPGNSHAGTVLDVKFSSTASIAYTSGVLLLTFHPHGRPTEGIVATCPLGAWQLRYLHRDTALRSTRSTALES
jgi:hypothetical protein